MRTTLTLDEDVAAELKRLSRKTGRPLKELVNDALRVGLHSRRAPAGRPYRLQPVSLGGVRTGVDLDRALWLADALDDEARRVRTRVRGLNRRSCQSTVGN
jgi:hypothetical protein